MNLTNYKHKYIKYKTKYCELKNNIKNIQIGGSSLDLEAIELSIHLIWIYANTDVSNNESYLIPNEQYLENIKKWCQLNPTSNVYLWYDSDMIPTKQLRDMKSRTENLVNEKNNFILQDIRELHFFDHFDYSCDDDCMNEINEIYEKNEKIDIDRKHYHVSLFESNINVYLRTDLIRMIIATEFLQNEGRVGHVKHVGRRSPDMWFIYADLDMPPNSIINIINEAEANNKSHTNQLSVIDKINKYGIVLGTSISNPKYENGFIIMKNNPKTIKAVKDIMIELSIYRIYNFMNTKNIKERINYIQLVYLSIEAMFIYLFALLNIITLVYEDEEHIDFDSDSNTLNLFANWYNEPEDIRHFDTLFKSIIHLSPWPLPRYKVDKSDGVVKYTQIKPSIAKYHNRYNNINLEDFDTQLVGRANNMIVILPYISITVNIPRSEHDWG